MATRCPLGLFLAIALLLVASPAQGRQQYRSSIPNGNGIPCPPEDPHCEENELCVGFGHESCAGGVISPKRNAFGKDFEAAGLEWSRELCEKDSDGDGFSNGYELGDPCCIWQEGAEIPEWMREWAISHPGFSESTQIPDENVDLKALCEKAAPLSEKELYNVGEDKITQDYVIDDHVIPTRETVYEDIRFNFPDDQTYYIVGAETLKDNADMVHHYVVKGCPGKAEKKIIGKVAESFGEGSGGDDNCEETLFIWAPGADLSIPLVSGFAVGKGTKRAGFKVQMHYDNPLLKEGETDASGIRFHMTTTPRKYEAGILWTGSMISVGVIPPKTKTYSSTIFQVKVDEEIAPDGLTVFGYLPHMHELGRRMWTERLERKSDSKGDLRDFSELEKVEDIGRDDKWRFDTQNMIPVSGMKIKNGEFISTTCLYDSSDRTEVTIGSLGSRDEMCIGYIAFYPSNAVDSVLLHSGPRFFSEMTDKDFKSVKSVTQILKNPDMDTELPTWRRAYLDGELECDEQIVKSRNILMPGKGVYIGEKTFARLGRLCGEEIVNAFTFGYDVPGKTDCPQECAAEIFSILGCSLLKEGKQSGGKTLPLYSSNMEIAATELCGESFIKHYEENKIDPQDF
ncbi:hypothetical protein BSKO_12443 [Bryopsis sp. KO-2023]|nr:hypothetical protein BSKO_12443 [Bryopsis sp. KO-2023]